MSKLLSVVWYLASSAAVAATPNIVVPQGGVGRWDAMAAESCGIFGKRYPAVDADCYYPVDIKAKVGTHEIVLYDQDGKAHKASLTVQKTDFPEIEITLEDNTYVTVSPENLKRHQEERKRVLALFKAEPGPPRFSLPLSPAARRVAKSEDDFGSLRKFNGIHTSQHTGRDFPVGAGQPVIAVAAGTVVLAEEQFFSGNTVFVDHGGGLISMNFHLSELSVKAGDEVKRGQTLGKVGSTGRSTGPHMHLGFRWVGARIDPLLLLESPNALPTVGDTRAEVVQKNAAAQEKEPPETKPEVE